MTTFMGLYLFLSAVIIIAQIVASWFFHKCLERCEIAALDARNEANRAERASTNAHKDLCVIRHHFRHKPSLPVLTIDDLSGLDIKHDNHPDMKQRIMAGDMSCRLLGMLEAEETTTNKHDMKGGN